MAAHNHDDDPRHTATENWENELIGASYDPYAAGATKMFIRPLKCRSKSEKKKHREAELLRIDRLKKGAKPELVLAAGRDDGGFKEQQNKFAPPPSNDSPRPPSVQMDKLRIPESILDSSVAGDAEPAIVRAVTPLLIMQPPPGPPPKNRGISPVPLETAVANARSLRESSNAAPTTAPAAGRGRGRMINRFQQQQQQKLHDDGSSSGVSSAPPPPPSSSAPSSSIVVGMGRGRPMPQQLRPPPSSSRPGRRAAAASTEGGSSVASSATTPTVIGMGRGRPRPPPPQPPPQNRRGRRAESPAFTQEELDVQLSARLNLAKP